MSKFILSALAAIACMISANAQAVSGSFTVTAQDDPYAPSGSSVVGYCRAWAVCVHCDYDWDPSCSEPVFYGYGSISNPYLSDGKELLAVIESWNQIQLTINTGTNPGAGYITNVSISCNGGTVSVPSPSQSFFFGWVSVLLPRPTQCMTNGNNYTLTIS